MSKKYKDIPQKRPLTPLLDTIDSPKQLRALSISELLTLADELRCYLLYCVGNTGGHFSSGLGVIELTIALHYILNTPEDRLIWDVGHQAYPHKILTGRRDLMPSLRKKEGLAAFPKRIESEYDAFGVGHSSTSISAALGMAVAAKLQGIHRKTVAVIGDGALTAGMAFEALNHATVAGVNMLVILNDNEMSISDNIGGLSNHLARVLSSKTYTNVRENGKKFFANLPGAFEFVRRTEEYAKAMLTPSTLFEALGWNYIGPIDGHDIPTLLTTLNNMKELPGLQFLHIVTKKGKGYEPAEKEPTAFHAISKIASPENAHTDQKLFPKYANVFGKWICDMAMSNERLVGITPAMKEGSDLVEFSQRFPTRYFDVAIAEQHAVTLAAGMACDGLKPVVAIYSTFLQRAYDQLIHDVAVQNLDILFAIDRAGLVGEDGPTHAGSFDLTYLRCIPNMVVMTPSDENELRLMLTTGFLYSGPAAVRYPRGIGPNAAITTSLDAMPIGKGILRQKGSKIALLVFGTLLQEAMCVAHSLNATVADMRFVKPLDDSLVLELAANHDLLVTIEENTIMGGAGSAINELLAKHNCLKPILNLGLPDKYIEHATPKEMLIECGLDANSIELAICNYLQTKQE